jgi:potassium efflux system protein
MIDDVASVLDGQAETVARLESRRADMASEYSRLADSAGNEELLARDPLPSGSAAWARVGRATLRLPHEITTATVAALRDVTAKFAAASAPLRLFAALAAAAVVCGLLLMRWLLRSRFAASPDNRLAAPVAALGDSIVSLLPAAIWWAVASVLGFEREAKLLIGSVLLIWPLVAVVLRFAGHVLFDGSADRKSLRVRRQFFRRLCWSTILGGLLAAILTLTATVELTPAMDNLIARGAMVCVVLIALPALQLRSLILAMAGHEAGFGVRVLAWLSLLVPTVLAGAAVIGLVGYLNLAWTIISHFLWLVLIGVALMLVLGVVDDLRDAFARRIEERNPAVGSFWVENFVDPAHRLLQLAFALTAGWLLVWIYGWDWTTPVIREAVAIGQIPILTLGESSLRLTDLASAVVLVALAFWVGGWSRQVSYNLALTRVRDQGIRQSLSTFIQYVVIVSGLLLTLKVIGLDLTALTVFAASVGVGIGFGMQTVVNNFVSGILLLVERPLKVTDVVTIGGETGEVSRIGIRSLTVQMFDRKELIIPNSEVIGGTFTNWTRVDDVLREILLFTISYQDNPALAARLVEEIARGTTGVMAHPAPKATTYEFTERGITVRLQHYVHQRGSVGGLDIRSTILERTHAAFARAGFTVPAANGDVALTAGTAPVALASPA